MEHSIRVRAVGRLEICVDGSRVEYPANRTRKGASVMRYLIMNGGEPVTYERLLNEFWKDESTGNPENALKTLVSRLRALLDKCCDGLSACIASRRGAYYWNTIEGVTVDLFEIDALLDEVAVTEDEKKKCAMYEQFMEMYAGALPQGGVRPQWTAPYAATLHDRCVLAMHSYIDLLETSGAYEVMASVCRRALDADPTDAKLQVKLMAALTQLDRAGEALTQYRHAVGGSIPDEELQVCYDRMQAKSKGPDAEMAIIVSELGEVAGEKCALVCDYSIFRELYALQLRNLERAGLKMGLAVVSLCFDAKSRTDALYRESVVNALISILEHNLRKGDTITRYSPGTLAILLPTGDRDKVCNVMERVRKLFYGRYSDTGITFDYRATMVGAE